MSIIFYCYVVTMFYSSSPLVLGIGLLFTFSYYKQSHKEHSGKVSSVFIEERIVVKISKLYAVKQNSITYPDLMYPLGSKMEIFIFEIKFLMYCQLT